MALRQQYDSDLTRSDGQIALPSDVVGIRLRQTFADRNLVAISLQGAGKIALRGESVTTKIVCHGDVMLPAGIAGIGLGQALSDRQRVLVRFQRLIAMALRREHASNPEVQIRPIALPAGIGVIGSAKRSTMPTPSR